ncbi:hypothetical protein Thimo_3521 [Thioflavicoccus mobilis 8321]|uniref:L,D-TPase catalytic domain-containing protein n=1 Tax=Thioflavicoccus mobilis 8321 TaxID=765912 RepID=L0GZK3_9GAMM|nr:L,D-transpeptidase family protein [Thioflavicoccus mobilis]AGA92183.1 hypothetical protein Thimo_3521 [Thioflavicoccus mobilis 8321]
MPILRVGGLCLAACLLSGLVQADELLRARLVPLDTDEANVAGVALASGPLLTDLYRTRGDRLAWDPARLAALRRLLIATRVDGFYRSDFHFREIDAVLREGGLAALPPGRRVEIDIVLSDSLLRYLHHHRFGKVDPRALDPSGTQVEQPSYGDLEQDLQAALAADDLEAYVARQFRWPRFYRDLRAGLARYREIAAAGGWSSVPDGPTLKPGMQDARVPVVRARLRATSDYSPEAAPPADPLRYDAGVQAAVERFQARHGLAVDGLVGPQTRAAMNVAIVQRIDQIRLNLERMRWLANDLPGDFVLVNIPAYRVDLYRDGAPIWSTRTIVGRPQRRTPVFRDELAYLEVNPTWTIPPTILAEDILPNMRADPGYLAERDLRVVDYRGNEIPPGTVDWNLPADNFPYLLRQAPSDENALGRIKFMFPNQFSVYLHDTPQRGLFARPQRAFSSGCVRVQDPLRLAELVLDDPQRWTQASLADLIATDETQVIRLRHPLAVLLAYWTAEGEGAGQVAFHPDIYGRDAALLEVLDGGPLRLRLAPPSEPATPVRTVDAAPDE